MWHWETTDLLSYSVSLCCNYVPTAQPGRVQKCEKLLSASGDHASGFGDSEEPEASILWLDMVKTRTMSLVGYMLFCQRIVTGVMMVVMKVTSGSILDGSSYVGISAGTRLGEAQLPQAMRS